MANVLADSAATLRTWLADHAGSDITYQRGQVSSEAITATHRQKEYEVTNLDGVTTSLVATDWIIWKSDLVVAGVVVTPRPGDRVLFGGEVYQVMAPQGSACCRDWDLGGASVVIHTKRVEA